MRRILLTGARAPVTLDLARHFHRSGYEVFLADSIRLPIARLSRTIKRYYVVSPPAMNPKKFASELTEIIRLNSIDLVVPTCEEIFFIAAYRHLLSEKTDLFFDSFEKLRRLHSKWEFASAIAGGTFSAVAPESDLLEDREALERWSQRQDLQDWVLKPVYSRFAARTILGATVKDLKGIQPRPEDPWIAQRFIRGIEYSTYSIIRSGEVHAHACYYSKYKAGPGSGIYFLPVEDASIRSFVQEFAKEFDYTGQVGFDLIREPNGKLYVLECNPRATSGLHLMHDLSICDAFMGVSGLQESKSMRPSMLASIMMLYSFPQACRKGRVGELIGDMLKGKDVLFDWKDPVPALLAPLSLVEVAARAVRTDQALTRASTYDIEWNGEPL